MKKTLVLIHKLEDYVLVLALAGMLGMALMQIVLRNVFDGGFLWAESFLRILVLWIAMLGAMVATRERNHINIDVLSKLLAPAWVGFVNVLGQLFAALVCFITAYYCFAYIQYEYQDGTIAFGDVPVWVCQSILPVGFTVMGLRFFLYLFLPKPQSGHG